MSLIIPIIVIVLVLLYITFQPKYATNTPKLNAVKDMMTPLFVEPYKTFNVPPNLIDYIEFYEDTSSYTLHKKQIYLDVRTNETLLIYSTLHEIAHVLCTCFGHSFQFYVILIELITRAQAFGLLKDNELINKWILTELMYREKENNLNKEAVLPELIRRTQNLGLDKLSHNRLMAILSSWALKKI